METSVQQIANRNSYVFHPTRRKFVRSGGGVEKNWVNDPVVYFSACKGGRVICVK